MDKKTKKREANRRYYERKKAKIKATENSVPLKTEYSQDSVPQTDAVDAVQDSIHALKPQTFDWKKEKKDIGFIAQDVIKDSVKNTEPEIFIKEIKTESKTEDSVPLTTEIKNRVNFPHYLKLSGLSIAVIAIIFFEIYESQKFYSAHDSGLPLFKSILAISAMTALSVLRTTEFKFLRYSVMLILILNQVWIMSSSLVMDTLSNIQTTAHLEQMVKDLEKQIEPKQSQLDWFEKKEWITRARKQDDKLTPFYDRLHALKTKQLDRLEDKKLSVIMVINSWALVMLRVCLLIVGLLCSRQLIK